MTSVAILLFVILGALACVAVGLVLIVLSHRRQADLTVPRCANCGYNLTGAPSNRCPECGQLFIEAGVITKPPPAAAPRQAVRAMVLIFVALTLCGVLGTIALGLRARGARARMAAARQAALQAQTQAQAAAAARAAASAPAADGGETGRP